MRSGIRCVNGVMFTVQSKEEMATILREKMRTNEVKIPYTPSKFLTDIDLTAELNIEKYQLMKTGHIQFIHPENSHDDVFWSCALAVYGSAKHFPPSSGVGVAFPPSNKNEVDDLAFKRYFS